jgi:hypothetical protein
MENLELRKKCIELSNQCIAECRVTAELCKNLPNLGRCMELCIRCAEECEFLMSICLKNAISNPEYYDRCSVSCANCAAECEKYDIQQLKQCAEICRKFQLTYIFQSYQTHQPIHIAFGEPKH